MEIENEKLTSVVEELKELNGLNDFQLEATLEMSSHIDTLQGNLIHIFSGVSDLLEEFIKSVPAAVMSGFDALIDFEKTQERLRSREEETDQQKEDAEEEQCKSKGKEPKKVSSKFAEGMEDPFSGLLDGIVVTLGDVMMIVGRIVGAVKSFGGLLLSGLKLLLRGLTAPFTLIIAGITAIVLGIDQAISDFMSMEGDISDKIMAGIFGFIDGILKIVTIPLDMIKNGASWILEQLGFEEISKVLDSFSFTDFVDEITDSVLEVYMKLKNWLVSKISGIAAPVLRFLGFEETADSLEKVSSEYANRDEAKQIADMSKKEETSEGLFGWFKNRETKSSAKVSRNGRSSTRRENSDVSNSSSSVNENTNINGSISSSNENNVSAMNNSSNQNNVSAVNMQGNQYSTFHNISSNSVTGTPGTVKTSSGTILTALNPYSVPNQNTSFSSSSANHTSTALYEGSVSRSNDRQDLSNQMISEQNRLETTRNNFASSSSNNNTVAVSAPSTTVNTTNISSGNPSSPYDKGDRTHVRRGRYRNY